MNLKELYDCVESRTSIYINDRKIKILKIFDIFNICEIMYIDNREKNVVDVMAITKNKEKNKFVSLHRLKRGNIN